MYKIDYHDSCDMTIRFVESVAACDFLAQLNFNGERNFEQQHGFPFRLHNQFRTHYIVYFDNLSFGAVPLCF